MFPLKLPSHQSSFSSFIALTFDLTSDLTSPSSCAPLTSVYTALHVIGSAADIKNRARVSRVFAHLVSGRMQAGYYLTAAVNLKDDVSKYVSDLPVENLYKTLRLIICRFGGKKCIL